MGKGYTCWLIDEADRNSLLARFPPEYEQVITHHITHAYKVPKNTPLPTATSGIVVGEIIDDGVQSLVVEIDGTTTRFDGETFHITVSIADNRYPENAKTLVRRGWYPVEPPIMISLTPTYIESTP